MIKRFRVQSLHKSIFFIISDEKLSLSVGFLSFAGEKNYKINPLENFPVK
jgi:hypothetical protein